MDELRESDRVEGILRPRIERSEVSEGRRGGWLIEDADRRRPRYFDGLLLKADDLTRDQDYFLKRQSDLLQLGGSGVVAGLNVLPTRAATALQITRGHGVTAAGTLVVLGDDLTVDVADVAKIQSFDAIFGLEARPDTPSRNRAGLFMLAMRRVEFTANPVASYPTSLQGDRVVHDGDVIEAAAITLIPFEEVAVTDAGTQGRSLLAHQIFVRGALGAMSPDVLPLAVIALERGEIVWVDEYLVRRDKGANEGMAFSRPVQEAFLHQYSVHLRDVRVAHAGTAGTTRAFVAIDHFQAVPAFGPLPLAAVQIEDRTLVQSFFPAEVGVELTVIPEDELPVLAEEALALGPLDLTASTQVLEDYQVLVVIPVPRASFATVVSELEGKLTRVPRPRLLRPTARLPPIAMLNLLRRRGRQALALPISADLVPWEAALEAVAARAAAEGDAYPVLYYVRRRRCTQVSFAASRFQALPPDAPEPTETMSSTVRDRLIRAGELDPLDVTARTTKPFDFLMRSTTNEVVRAAESLLSMPAFATERAPAAGSTRVEDSTPVNMRIMVNAVVEELAYRTRLRLDDLIVSEEANASVVALAGEIIAPAGSAPVRVRALSLEDVSRTRERYEDPTRGDGLALLTSYQSELAQAQVRAVIARSLRVPELDGTASALATDAERIEFAAQLLAYARLEEHVAITTIRDMVDARYGPVEGGPDEVRFDAIDGFPGSGEAIKVGEGRLYHLIHSVADDAVRQQLSAILFHPDQTVREDFNLPFIVSSLLAQLLLEGWDLRLRNATEVQNVLELLDDWKPGALYDPAESQLPPETLPRLTFTGDVKQIFEKFEQLRTTFSAALPTLDSVLEPLGTTLSELRCFGLAGNASGSFPSAYMVVNAVVAHSPSEQLEVLQRLRDAAADLDLARIRQILQDLV